MIRFLIPLNVRTTLQWRSQKPKVNTWGRLAWPLALSVSLVFILADLVSFLPDDLGGRLVRTSCLGVGATRSS